MPIDVILRQSFEFRGIGVNYFLAVGDVAIEHRLLFGGLFVQLFQAGAGRVIFVDAGKPELQKLALNVVASGGVSLRKLERRKRVVHLVIQGDRRLRSGGLGEHGRGVIPEICVGMYVRRCCGEVSRGIVLVHGFVEGS